jgi:hypothetical protein
MRSPPSSRLSSHTTDVVDLIVSPYPSILSPLNRPLIYCGRAGSPGACPQTCRPDIALVRAARLPGPTRRALSGILVITRNRVRTRAIGSLVRTPLVMGKRPVHSVVMRQFWRPCPLHSSRNNQQVDGSHRWSVRLRVILPQKRVVR